MQNDNAQSVQKPRAQPYPNELQPGVYESNNLPANLHDNKELFRVKAVWYLDFFPDELVIHQKTVSVIRRSFLMSYVETMPVRDVGEVEFSEVFVFAALSITGKNPEHKLNIANLPKEQAEKAKELLDRLLVEYETIIGIPDWPHELS
jgi:hypothetical protein